MKKFFLYIKSFFRDERGKQWIFPLVLFLIILLLSVFHIHGSSIGIYQQVFEGKDTKDPNLIANQPQMSRSDEWMVNSGYTFSQIPNNYSEKNKFIGNGLDITIDTDAPYRGWSMIFKPQNLAFFIMPFSVAFAFKWWIIGYALIISCYFFILYFLPRKIWLAILLSLSLFFSPFVQWWYQSITLLPIAYSFLAMLLLFKITECKNSRRLMLYGTLLAYLAACFVLIMYPPFVIPCLLVVGVTYISYLLQNYKSILTGPWKKQLLILVLSGTVAAIIVGLFIFTRLDVIKALRQSVYPGSRITNSGGYRTRLVFDGLFNIFLQNPVTAKAYYTNQSEASRFVLIFPFLILPLVYIFIKKALSQKKIDYHIAGLLVLIGIFLARVMTTLPNIVFKLFFLHRAPAGRLIIVFGMLNVMAIIFLVRYLENKKRLPKSITFISVIFTVLFNFFVLRALYNYYPQYLKPYSTAIWMIITLGGAIWLLLIRKATLASVIILTICFLSTYQVNPLYRGTQVVYNDTINQALRRVDPAKRGTWAVVQGDMLTTYLMMNGYKAASGIYLYPDLKFWHKFDKNLDEETVYNRCSHALFIPNAETESNKNFELTAQDFFWVLINGCNNNIQKNIDFVMSHVPLKDKCLEPITESIAPNLHFYFYKVIKKD